MVINHLHPLGWSAKYWLVHKDPYIGDAHPTFIRSPILDVYGFHNHHLPRRAVLFKPKKNRNFFHPETEPCKATQTGRSRYTLPKTNIAPENEPSQKEISIPTIHFQVPC